MIKVYKVKLDVNHYQFFLPADEKVWSTDLLLFDGTPRAERWLPPEVYVLKPKLKRGNFFGIMVGSNCLIFDDSTREGIYDLLVQSGEVLPLPHEGVTFHLLNVTECINALDQQLTQWRVTDGVRTSIDRYVFHPNRVFEAPLFKIPETCKGEILVAERTGNPDDEFKARVEQLGLTGLIFKEIWRDEE